MTRMAGKVAFVTGAGGGIGRAICERFLAEGALVAATDIVAEGAVAAISNIDDKARAIGFECDVGDSESVRSAIARTVATFGRLDVLCNVAGGSTSRDDAVTEAPEDEFWRAIRLDLFGTFLTCKHGLPELIKAGGGSVINMASMVALMAVPRKDCYTAAKGGVISLSRSMAAHYAQYSIRVNAIAPGIVMTPRVEKFVETNEYLKGILGKHLLGPAMPVDIAQMAVYLGSDESRVVTGQVFPVDSGVTIT